jgi:myo-inositol-1(or 4)-monophosphatase
MLQTAIKVAKDAGEILIDNFRKITSINLKDKDQLVTNVDLAAEEKIVSVIQHEFPYHSFLTEESGRIDNCSKDYVWIIDPLDGTTNYVHEFPLFGVSIALEHMGEVILGVVYFPCMNHLYTAEKGKGAFLNGEKITVSSKFKLSKSLILYSSSTNNFREKTLPSLDVLSQHAFKIRMFGSGSYNLCSVALGVADAYIEFNNKPWDNAAGFLIIREAGGTVTTLNGNEATLNDGTFLASNGKIHKQLVDLMGKIK